MYAHVNIYTDICQRQAESQGILISLTVDNCDQDISLPEVPDTGGHTGFKPSFVTPSLGTFKHQCEPFCSDFISVVLIKYLEKNNLGNKGVLFQLMIPGYSLSVGGNKAGTSNGHITSSVESQEKRMHTCSLVCA